METIYTVTGKETDIAFEFKYNLNGDITAFKIIRGRLNPQQAKWLFSGRFPAFEAMMTGVWLNEPDFKKRFKIERGAVDLSFETFYKAYNHKIKKLKAEAAWNKLNKADKLEAIKGISAYNGYLKRTRVAKANPEAYLNQRRWEDDFNSIH
ncbi:hypothetical protein [Psychroflexus sp. ALD_RP9]|uniref:hypothetical protein n=1 Tax=Psychroflexus sp. ALD_RP9 TaxID=2777186 RepID=UPI001A90A355|nr:hypothetical protein [Psychroflexus sp. ALD_RP9]QSS96605.1 hypothetical protein IMZ30_09145 [Psychroflexus sp. ALD_RP9]